MKPSQNWDGGDGGRGEGGAVVAVPPVVMAPGSDASFDGGSGEDDDAGDPEPMDAAFEEAAAAAGLGGLVGYGRGAAFVDMDSDGWDDLFVVDTDDWHRGADHGLSSFYRNLGGGRFERFDAGFADADLQGGWVASFADYDNDGDPDALLAGGGYTMKASLVLYENRMAQEGKFVSRTVASGVAAAAAGVHAFWGATWADYDNDGYLDAVVTRREGQPLVLHNQGDGTFEDRAAALGISLAVVSYSDLKNPVFFDYDGDGDQDLYLAGMGTHGLFENRGMAGFTDVTDTVLGPLLGSGRPTTFAALALDYDQDGLDDLYLGRWHDQDMIVHNLGGGNFEALHTGIGLVTSLTVEPFENTMGLGVGDLFDDGFPDLFIGTGDPANASYDIMFCNDGTGGYGRCSHHFDDPADPHYLTRAHGMVTADVDRDGDTDLFRNLGGHPTFDAANAGVDSREENKLHLRLAQDPNTAALQLQGVVSNRDGIGARITVEGSETHHYRMRSTQAFQSQNSATLTVTLGQAALAQVTVHWPSGMTTQVQVRSGERLRIVEGVGVAP